MLDLESTALFRQSYKHLMRSGRDIGKLDEVIGLLRQEEGLPPKYKDHQLKGNLKHMRECHIEKNWLLLYHVSNNTLVLADTGTHSELLNK